MHIKVKQISGILPNAVTEQQFQHWAKSAQIEENQVANQVEVPKLDFIPMMQRRRLSKFARMTFYCLHQLDIKPQAAMVFASRFGDLNKTDKLIETVNEQQPLSPAQFGLSVHNAVAGLYSILTDNQQSSNTVSAGVDSFHMGLIDAITRLQQSSDDEIVLICTEGLTPEKYHQYIGEQQIEHCVAMVLSKQQGRSLSLSKLSKSPDNPSKATQSKPLPQALQFLAWYYGNEQQNIIASNHHCWRWQND